MVQMPTFGRKKENEFYVSRPGSYALVFDPAQKLLVFEIMGGYFLPGGGLEPGETAEAGLQREILEECGYTIALTRKIGETMEYFFAQGLTAHVELHSTFFVAQMVEKVCEPVEINHNCLWLTPAEASQLLTRHSQVWAVEQVMSRENQQP